VVIGKDGRVAAIFPKVKVAGHAQEVAQAVEALG
jgi:peroxiredoxin